jgi:hypothetical protein
MSWERRNGRGSYFTKSRKVGGRVIREYIGGGMTGVLAAQRDAQECQQRAAEREYAANAFAQVREQYQAIDALLAALDARCRKLMREELERAGFHQHERGEWRRRRETK